MPEDETTSPAVWALVMRPVPEDGIPVMDVVDDDPKLIPPSVPMERIPVPEEGNPVESTTLMEVAPAAALAESVVLCQSPPPTKATHRSLTSVPSRILTRPINGSDQVCPKFGTVAFVISHRGTGYGSLTESRFSGEVMSSANSPLPPFRSPVMMTVFHSRVSWRPSLSASSQTSAAFGELSTMYWWVEVVVTVMFLRLGRRLFGMYPNSSFPPPTPPPFSSF